MPALSVVGTGASTLASNVSNVLQEGISLSNGTLTIVGNEIDNEAHVTVSSGKVKVSLSVNIIHIASPGLGTPSFDTPIEVEAEFSLQNVTSIFFYGFDGNDKFFNETAISSTAYGGSGNDQLYGGSGIDHLYGNANEDWLEGRGGNDMLEGGTHSDRYIFGGSSLGHDQITEASNADQDYLDFSVMPSTGIKVDLARTSKQQVQKIGTTTHLELTLTSNTGVEGVQGTYYADTVYGNSRPNSLSGLDGIDELRGLGGNDTLYGGNGEDLIFGADGEDQIWGQGGADVINGGNQGDTIYGGSENDTLSGGNGNDLLYGDAGSNTIQDGLGHDYVDFSQNAVAINYTTQGGNDTVIGTAFNDTITGTSGHDRLEGRGGNDTLNGGAGNDVLIGATGSNSIHDGTGNDTIDFSQNAVTINYTTEGGNDTVIGTPHDDIITGGGLNDRLEGRGGNDQLFGRGGTDELFGGAGNDWLEAGSAAEAADGGWGNDYNAHIWAFNGTTFDDIDQRLSETCVFLSSLSGAALQGIDLASRITYLGNFRYQVQLFNWDSEAAHTEEVVFTGALPGFANSVTDQDPGPHWSAFGSESWTVLYQRAYLQMMNANNENFRDPDYALYALTGREVVDGDSRADVKAALDQGKVVIAAQADDGGLVYDDHSYTVMAVYQVNGEWFIRLRNPWGFDVDDADHQAYGDPNDGIIEMSWTRFWDADYCDFDRVSIS